MDEYFLRRNLDFIRAGFYAQGSAKDFSEGAGRVQGEAPGWLYYGLVRTRTDSYGRTRTDLYGRILVRTRTDGLVRTRTDGLVRTRTDGLVRTRTDETPMSLLRTVFHFTTDSYGLVRTAWGDSPRTRTDVGWGRWDARWLTSEVSSAFAAGTLGDT